jgi:hypothetical protein
MNNTDIIGTAGVTLLLLAFALNLFFSMQKENWIYLLLNLAGAALAWIASILLVYWPFIVLEAAWTIVTLIGIIRKIIPRKIAG